MWEGKWKPGLEGFKGRRTERFVQAREIGRIWKRSLTLPGSHRAAVLWEEGQGEGLAKGQLQQHNVKRLFVEYINKDEGQSRLSSDPAVTSCFSRQSVAMGLCGRCWVRGLCGRWVLGSFL